MNDLNAYSRGELERSGHITHSERLRRERARERWLVFTWLAGFALLMFVGGIFYFLTWK